jgi:hypothetical protein
VVYALITTRGSRNQLWLWTCSRSDLPLRLARHSWEILHKPPVGGGSDSKGWFWGSGHIQPKTSPSVSFRVQPFASWESGNPDSPDVWVADDRFTANHHSVAINNFDGVPQANFDTKPCKVLLHFSGELLGERAEDPSSPCRPQVRVQPKRSNSSEQGFESASRTLLQMFAMSGGQIRGFAVRRIGRFDNTQVGG